MLDTFRPFALCVFFAVTLARHAVVLIEPADLPRTVYVRMGRYLGDRLSYRAVGYLLAFRAVILAS